MALVSYASSLLRVLGNHHISYNANLRIVQSFNEAGTSAFRVGGTVLASACMVELGVLTQCERKG
jgi:hypothetical protein